VSCEKCGNTISEEDIVCLSCGAITPPTSRPTPAPSFVPPKIEETPSQPVISETQVNSVLQAPQVMETLNFDVVDNNATQNENINSIPIAASQELPQNNLVSPNQNTTNNILPTNVEKPKVNSVSKQRYSISIADGLFGNLFMLALGIACLFGFRLYNWAIHIKKKMYIYITGIPVSIIICVIATIIFFGVNSRRKKVGNNPIIILAQVCALVGIVFTFVGAPRVFTHSSGNLSEQGANKEIQKAVNQYKDFFDYSLGKGWKIVNYENQQMAIGRTIVSIEYKDNNNIQYFSFMYGNENSSIEFMFQSVYYSLGSALEKAIAKEYSSA
jgi:hypothetical protein